MSKFKINIFKITKISLLYSELLPYKNKATEQLRHLCSKKVGKVVFPTVIMRPNNTQAISKFIKFLINPGPNYIKAVDYNIYYLVSNKYLAIKYKAKNKNSKLITVTDKIFTVAAGASYKKSPDKRSGEGYIFKLFEDAIN